MPSADESLALELYPGLRRFAAVVAPAEVAPDDLVQEALIAVLRRGALSDLEDPGAYLRRTMLNLASNHRRRFGRARRALVRLRGGERAAAADAYPSDLADLTRLTPAGRAVLYLHHVEGLSLDAVAARLEIRPSTARQIASRGRRQLRRYAEEDS